MVFENIAEYRGIVGKLLSPLLCDASEDLGPPESPIQVPSCDMQHAVF